MSLDEASELLRAIGALLWPLIIVVLVVLLFPQLKEILGREITIQRGSNKVTFSKAADQFASEIADLRAHVSRMLAEGAPGATIAEPVALADEQRPPPAGPRRILWVDDHPENNAFLIDSLREGPDRAVVVEAPSTKDALAKLADDPAFDLVITDLARKEDGTERQDAGIALIEALRGRGIRIPVIAFPSAQAAQTLGPAALAVGAVAVTASPTELRALIRFRPGSPFEASVEERLRTDGIPYRPVVVRRTVDLVVERGGQRTGIEIKNWPERPPPPRVTQLIAELERARTALELDDVVIVVRDEVRLPLDPRPPDWARVVTVDDLVATLS